MWTDAVRRDFPEELGLGLGFAERVRFGVQASRQEKLLRVKWRQAWWEKHDWTEPDRRNRGPSNSKLRVWFPLDGVLLKQRGHLSLT